MPKQTISVIIPTLNEEDRIATTLHSVMAESVELIVVDGGSQDGTCTIARKLGATVLTRSAGRGAQMNRGAEIATGDILLFLHADTELPRDYVQAVHECLAQPRTVLGAFRLHLQGTCKGLAMISWGANLRSRWLGLVYGDQGLFLEKEIFQAVGGFPETAIMEDFRLVQQLRKKGRVRLAATSVQSSGRRWDKRGLWMTTLVNQMIILGFFFGLSADFLAKIYGVRKDI